MNSNLQTEERLSKKSRSGFSTKSMAIIAMLCTLAYIIMVVGRVPMVLFLKYDPKDVIIAIGGLIWGPAYALIVSLIVSFIEFMTVSNDGLIGLFMNVLSTTAFACTAAAIYRKRRTMAGALIGLFVGLILMTALMLLWNYIVTPAFMNIPRSEVVKLLVPAILPFNLIKGGLNLGFTLLLYKPIVKALRKSHLIPPAGDGQAHAINWTVISLASLILISCVVFAFVMNGII